MYRGLLAILAVGVSTSAHCEWYKAETAHVIVEADAPPESVSRFAWEIEQVDGLLRTITGVAPSAGSGKLTIYAVDDVSTLRGLVTMPDGAGAFYTAGDLDELAAVGMADRQRLYDHYDYRWPLYHEYCHYFMAHHMGQIQPMWFVEGFASLCESIQLGPTGAISYATQPGTREPDGRIVWISLQDLLTHTPEGDHNWGVQFYAEGWLLSHYYYFGNSPRRAELDAYFQKVRAGESVSNLDSLFAGGVAGLETDLRAYLKRRPFATRTLAPISAPGTGVQVSPLPAAEAALVTTRIHLTGIHEYKDVYAIRDSVLAVARANPGNEKVAQYAAWLAFLCGEYKAAEELIQPFVSSTQSGRILALKGLLVARHALDEADADHFNPMVRDGRKYIDRALKLTPDDPLIMVAMYESLEAEMGPTPPEAFAMLDQALAVAPANDGLRFQLVEALIHERQWKRAIDVLRPLANSPHASRASYKAKAYITQLERRLSSGS